MNLVSGVSPGNVLTGVAGFLLFALSLSGGARDDSPRILIFNGLPGDEAHHHFFEKNLGDLRKTLGTRFMVPADRLSIFYGPKEAGYDGIPTRETVLAALRGVIDLSRRDSGKPASVWLIFLGHANRIPGGANLNLPGPDLSTTDLARALRDFPREVPLVIVATTAAGSDFLKALSREGRIVIAASVPRDPVTETEFPRAFTAALAAEETDTDDDGRISALELFIATKQRVIRLYESAGYMIREHAQLDGNGDGQGTQRPADVDAEPAGMVALTLPQTSKFE